VIEVLATGPLATVQDSGRLGYAGLGVARAGAFDRAALRAANRLVGNPPGAAGIEFVHGGLVVRCTVASTVAATGAVCAGFGWGVARTVAAGSVLRFGAPAAGLRSYLAVRGGIDVEPELGSRSTDTLGGLGPAPLASGDVLAVGPQPGGPVPAADTPPRFSAPAGFRIVAGPRDDWFAPAALDALISTLWTVRPDSDRVGIRLDGPPLLRARSGELPSEPTLPGALQVPPDGRPILFGPDAPTTGGYPVIAVVRDADLDGAAQLRPGDPVRFNR
jgi:biotin-dependent carboxylase-like uncharacterized protein